MTTRRRQLVKLYCNCSTKKICIRSKTRRWRQFLTKRLHGNQPLVEFTCANYFTMWLLTARSSIKRLSSKATNWSLRRMAAIDRNVLRLGAYEILMTDTRAAW
ncbi:MAG: transcription antitermination factor NusB [Pirellulaceae bacterium]